MQKEFRMRLNLAAGAVAVIVVLAACAAARAETAAESFASGEKLLTKGDFQGALNAYAAALRADQANQEYAQHYAMLRRILQLRKSLGEEKDLERWENTARALHAFYVEEKLYRELLALGQQAHQRLNNQWSAVALAETQLSLDRNQEAVTTLAELGPNQTSPTAQALLGIACARSGQVDRAKQIAASLKLPPEADPPAIYAAARLSAAVGDSKEAVRRLTECMQSVLPSRQDGFRAHAKACPEFAALATSAEFAKAISAESKLPESKCSGGKSCAGCPMRGNCPHSQGQ
jgi:hypothetical protein